MGLSAFLAIDSALFEQPVTSPLTRYFIVGIDASTAWTFLATGQPSPLAAVAALPLQGLLHPPLAGPALSATVLAFFLHHSQLPLHPGPQPFDWSATVVALFQ